MTVSAKSASAVKLGTKQSRKTYTGVYQRVMEQTRERAQSEGDGYTFVANAERTALVCFNPASQGRYLVCPESCSCPQYQQRASRVGGWCKHIEEARRRNLFATMLLTTEERRANFEREKARDFPW